MSFPKQILSQINENTGGGCILAIITGDKNFEIYTHFDDAVTQRALIDFLESRVVKMREIQENPWDEQMDSDYYSATKDEEDEEEDD